jgi:hypothetical protein
MRQDGVQMLASFLCDQHDLDREHQEAQEHQESQRQYTSDEDADDPEQDSALEKGSGSEEQEFICIVKTQEDSDTRDNDSARCDGLEPEFVDDDEFDHTHPQGDNHKEFVCALALTSMDSDRESMSGRIGGSDDGKGEDNERGVGGERTKSANNVEPRMDTSNNFYTHLGSRHLHDPNVWLQVMSRKDVIRLRDSAMGAIFNLAAHLIPARVGCDFSAARHSQPHMRDLSILELDVNYNFSAARGSQAKVIDTQKSDASVKGKRGHDLNEEKADRFTGVQKGGNGEKEPRERQALSASEVEEIFEILDQNGDGQISMIEFIKGLRADPALAFRLDLPSKIAQEDKSRDIFQHAYGDMDVDRSKSISLDEFSSYYLSQRPRSTSTSSAANTANDTTQPTPSTAGASANHEAGKWAVARSVGAEEVVGGEVQSTGFAGVAGAGYGKSGQPGSRNDVNSERGGDEKVGEEGQNVGNGKSMSSEQMFATHMLASREILSAVYRFRV